MRKQTLLVAINFSLLLFSPLLWRGAGGEAFAQLTGINYQAVAIDEAGKGIPGMDINGQAIPDRSITVRFSILDSSSTGPILYQETHNTNTDMYGLFSLVIGTGNVTSLGQYSSLAQLPWQTANQFLKVEIDIKKDGNYKLVSIQKLMAVPYAFYAAKSDTALYALNADTTGGTTTGWKLTGNDSINPSTQFIGTTDSVDFVFRTNNNEKMRLTGRGNLGIGTNNPNGLGIRVGGQNLYGKIIDIKSIDLNAVRLFHSIYNINTGLIQEYDGTTFYSSVGNVSNHKFAIKTNNIERITIDTAGNVGIGTTAPTVHLQINGDGSADPLQGSTGNILGIADTRAYNSTSVGGTLLLGGNFNSDPGAGLAAFAGIKGVKSNPIAGDYSGQLEFFTRSNGDTTWAGDQRMVISSTGNVGIGTTTPNPAMRLDVKGAGATAATYGFGVQNGAGNYSLVVRDDGFVGISSMLEVAGQIKITDGTQGAGKVLTSDLTGLASWTTPSVGGVDSVNGVAPIFSTGGTNPQISVAVNSQSSAGVVDSGGTNYNKVWKTDASGNPGWRSDSSDFSWIPGTGLSLSGNTLNSVWSSSGTDIYNNNTGNVGIGTTPTAKLDVKGSGTTNASYGLGVRNSADNYALVVRDDGKVGIGTTLPIYQLESYQNLPGSDFTGLSVVNGSGNNSSDVSILLRGNIAGTSNRNLFIKFRPNPNTIDPGWYAGYDGTNAHYALGPLNGTGDVQVPFFVIKSTGNIGIGTTTPSALLDIAGQVKITDGTEGVGKVLTSDAAGLASWTTPSVYNPGTGLTLSGDTLNSVWTASGTNIYNNNTGNVGIGTTSPAAKLDIKPTSGSSLYLRNTGGALRVNVDGNGNMSIGNGIQTILGDFQIGGINSVAANMCLVNPTLNAGDTLGKLRFHGYNSNADDIDYAVITGMNSINTAGSEQGRIDLNTYNAGILDARLSVVGGNVGIGTVGPTSILHTIAFGAKTASYTGNLLTNTATSSTSSVTKAGLEVKSTGTWNGASASNIGLYVSSVTGGTNNYDAIFNGGGNVGIGTTNPTTALDILKMQDAFIRLTDPQWGAPGTWMIGNGNTGTGNGNKFRIIENNGNTLRFSIESGGAISFPVGNVGIGTTNPASRLDINDNITPAKLILRRTGAGNVGISLQQNGYTAFGIVARSDANRGLAFVDNYTEFTGDGSGTDLMRITWDGKVGIGTSNPDVSAKLDITSNNSGILIPRIALTGTNDVTTIPSPATSLMIYNTATAGSSPDNVVPGFYYWNGTKWVSLSGGSGGNDWALLGNTGTVDGTNFIGTIDNVPFNIRVNNEKAGKIDPVMANTFWGHKAGNANTTGGSNTAVGEEALKTNTIGLVNTAMGAKALYSNTSGSGSVAVGFQSLYSNTTGLGNVAIGPVVLYSNTTGDGNIAIGPLGLYSNINGDGNIAIGDSALFSNTSGIGNTALGIAALLNNTGTGNVAIGPQALYSNTTGGRNVATGDSALYRNTTGDINVAYGSRALFKNISGEQNTAVGAYALYENTGDYNTATGAYSLNENTSGLYNTANGIWALGSNTTGIFNTATGGFALSTNTTGIFNTATGVFALTSNIDGSYNTGNGMSALEANISGSNNAAYGYQALKSNTTGIDNTANGYNALYSNTTANYNTAIGKSALYANTTGVQNTALGMNSLAANTIGNYNTALGLQALYQNTTANWNTASGAYALYSNDTGKANTADGAFALYSNTFGNYNTALGEEALYNNTTGGYGTAVGMQALFSNTTGIYNTALGQGALYTNSTGNRNTAIGLQAMYYNFSGNYNTASGMSSLKNNITGSYNTGTGLESLYNNSTGNYNTASGAQALFNNTSGINNTAIGTTTLYNNITGGNNTAVGRNALYSNTFGAGNTATGRSALYSNTIGNSNSAYGILALYSNTTGNYNTAIGDSSLSLNTSGTINTATGTHSLYSNSTGNYNTATGGYSLYSNTSGSYNTAVGEDALKANLTGTYNTAIGYQAYDAGTAYTNSTAIGYKAQITASNTIQLGNNNITDVKTSGAMTANGYTTAFSAQSGNYTLTALDDIVAVIGTATISLPTAVGIAGRKYTIKNIDPVQTITVAASIPETIDGAPIKTLTAQYQYITIVSDGSDWLIIANN